MFYIVLKDFFFSDVEEYNVYSQNSVIATLVLFSLIFIKLLGFLVETSMNHFLLPGFA